MDLVEFKTPKLDSEGELTMEVETRRGYLHHWGVRTTIDERTDLPVTNTVAIVQEHETGSIICLDPEELTIIS